MTQGANGKVLKRVREQALSGLFGINRNSPSDFRSLARIFLLPLELQSWAVREAITGVAQLRSSKGRRKIRARDLKLLGELRFIPNKRMHIEPKTS